MGDMGGKQPYNGAPEAIRGGEEIMSKKAHGTTEKAPESNLRWNADHATADRICCFNRHYAEPSGSWGNSNFRTTESAASGEITFYDCVSKKPLFVAPRGRSWEEFMQESNAHGWPSFRDEELVVENVRVLEDGETVSVDGTHLGHNLPSADGRNRYCINLVSVAGNP